ncbi:MAG: type II and III secretion system protein [Alistipes sp.]|jgi:type II secretory pathway component HofQ|nr:type II and III secretion system protein [Alistipes sp.]
MKRMKHITLLLAATLSVVSAVAQTIVDPDARTRRLAEIEMTLAGLIESHPEFASEVDISVGRQQLPELLRNVARAAGVNISVKGTDGVIATCNFSRARVTDLLYFLCKEHDLDLDVVGNIVSVAPAAKQPVPPRLPGVSYRIAGNLLSLNLAGDRLGDVTKRITDLTGANFILPPGVAGQSMSGYVKEMPFAEAIGAIAAMNGLVAGQDSTRVWILSVTPPPAPAPQLQPDRDEQQKHTSPAPFEVVEMKYRSSNKLSEVIPKDISSGVQIREFHDLNSVILSGEASGVSQVKAFLDSIDRRVPLVTIEVMIVDATKQRLMEIGVDAGFGKAGVASGGSLAGVDVMLNAGSVNRLINSFNGFGSVNLGMVNEGFYLGLQFLEDNGVIEMQSTPKLSTLNGHEATLTSGETRYYKEMANNYYGSQITLATESYVWKPIEANLEVKITPWVSEDRQITLDISIDQTEFTAREEAEAPPGTATRKFQSLIRVRNEEMVLLGGIDQNLREKSNRGLPWIARVPVIRWFFGKSRDNKSERRLSVFIKPTLVE